MSKRNNGIEFKIQMKSLNNNDKKIVDKMFPEHFKLSKHAIEQMEKRKFKYNVKEIAHKINIENVLEIQVQENKQYKFLVRFNVNCFFDLVLVVSSNGVICTNWLNSVNDNHATLKDKHLYTNDIQKLKAIL